MLALVSICSSCLRCWTRRLFYAKQESSQCDYGVGESLVFTVCFRVEIDGMEAWRDPPRKRKCGGIRVSCAALAALPSSACLTY